MRNQRRKQKAATAPPATHVVPSDLDADIWELVDRMMQEEYSKRASSGATTEELERFSEELEKNVARAMQAAAKKHGRILAKTLDRGTLALLRNRRQLFRGFESRLRKTWKEGLDRYEALVHTYVEYGKLFATEVFAKGAPPATHRERALTRLHARSCRVALEVMVLLKAGFSDGAHARWRTLHEIATTSLFLADNSEEIAERYLLHAIVRKVRSAEVYQKHCRAWGYEPLSDAEISRGREASAALIARFGKGFDRDYGWAAPALEGRATFSSIEEVTLPHWRTVYGWASGSVHAGADGLDPLGVRKPPDPVFLPGPSNSGLADPGQHSALSIGQICAAIDSVRPGPTRSAMTHAMLLLVRKCQNAFMKGHRSVEKLRKSDLAAIRRNRNTWTKVSAGRG